MNARRRFVLALGGGLLAGKHSAGAQPARTYRLGFISVASAATMTKRDESFRRGLRELGYVEGRNIVIDYRWADGNNERLPALAAELVRLKPDVIVTHGALATRAVQQATTTIPIVIAAAGDPVATGLVASLARPGGNTTGLTVIAPETSGKRLELLREAVPALARVSVLWNAANPVSIPELKETETAARAFALQLHLVGVNQPEEITSAFSSINKQGSGAVLVLSDAMFFGQRQAIADLAVAHRLAGITHLQEFTEAGLLMSYGPNVLDLHRRAATYVDRILRGASPASLPIEQPSKFDFAVNLRTAKAIGLAVPKTILARADRVIS
jgi:putative ABC transport system substrate-binding protein